MAPKNNPKEAKMYPANTEQEYNRPPQIGPKIVPDCHATALSATASGNCFLSTILGKRAAAAGEKKALTIPIPINNKKRTGIFA